MTRAKFAAHYTQKPIGVEFVAALTQKDPTRTVQLIAEYVQECEHEAWGGVPSRDLPAVRRLLEDIALYLQHAD